MVQTDGSLELAQLDIFYWTVVYATFPHLDQVKLALHHWPVFIHQKFFTCFIKKKSWIRKMTRSSLYFITWAKARWQISAGKKRAFFWLYLKFQQQLFTPVRTKIQIWGEQTKSCKKYNKSSVSVLFFFLNQTSCRVSVTWLFLALFGFMLLISTNINVTSVSLSVFSLWQRLMGCGMQPESPWRARRACCKASTVSYSRFDSNIRKQICLSGTILLSPRAVKNSELTLKYRFNSWSFVCFYSRGQKTFQSNVNERRKN